MRLFALLALVLAGCLAPAPERPCGGVHGYCHSEACMTPLCDWAERHRAELDRLNAGEDVGEIGP